MLKCPAFCSPLAINADYGQLKITPEDDSGFSIGMGVIVTDNVFDKCTMKGNSYVGLRFREDRDTNGVHCNNWHNCMIEDNTKRE